MINNNPGKKICRSSVGRCESSGADEKRHVKRLV